MSESLALREHFATSEQQRDTATIGMWIFIISEMMLFAALFTGYAAYRISSPQAFNEGSAGMNVLLGSINTAVLLTSSLTMALAVFYAQKGNQRLLVWLLIVTLALGCLFIGIKLTEYVQHFHEHKMPGIWYDNSARNARVQMFYVFYFILTGLHVIHLVIGIGLVLLMLVRSITRTFSAEYQTPVEMVGIYWSFVDVIWTFLYAIFYIPGLHL